MRTAENRYSISTVLIFYIYTTFHSIKSQNNLLKSTEEILLNYCWGLPSGEVLKAFHLLEPVAIFDVWPTLES